MAAGLELFGTVGYAGTSIDDICAASGVTARHLYELFAGREALLRAVYDDIIASTQRAVVQALALAQGAESRATAGIAAFVRSYLEDPRRARIACLEVIGVSPDIERHRRAIIHSFAGVIEAQARALVAQGVLPAEGDYELVGIAGAGAINELIADWLGRRDKPSVERFVSHVAGFFLVLMRGGAGGLARPSR